MRGAPRSVAQEPLDLQHVGISRAIGAYVVQTDDGLALFDCGPATCLQHLRDGLASRGLSLDDIRHILLSHIHLDHAGATGAIVRDHPHIQVHVSAIGAPHVIAPERLEASARRLYGADFDRLWGALQAVPEETLWPPVIHTKVTGVPAFTVRVSGLKKLPAAPTLIVCPVIPPPEGGAEPPPPPPQARSRARRTGAASRLKVPVIVHTEHGKTIQTLKQKLLAWYAAKFAQKYYCVSMDIARSVTGLMVPRGKVEVVANGIDVEHLASVVDNEALRKRWNISPGAVVIGTVGRLAQVKRQDLMLDVFQRVRGKIPGAILLIVGDGPKRLELEQQAKELGVYDAVRFAGFQSEPGPFLQLMSAFLLTSESEGMPMSLLEAWAVGVPAISFRVGGLPELIHDDDTGFLANFGDTEKMSRYIVNVVENGQLAQRLAAACRRQARERFDVKVMAKQYDDRYRQLLAGRQG